MLLLPLLPDLNLVLLFFFIGTHSLPTHPLHSSSTGSILAKLLKTQAYTRYFAPTRAHEPKSPSAGNGAMSMTSDC